MKKTLLVALAAFSALSLAAQTSSQDNSAYWLRVFLHLSDQPTSSQIYVLQNLKEKDLGTGTHSYTRDEKNNQLIVTFDTRNSVNHIQSYLQSLSIVTTVDSTTHIAPYEARSEKVGTALGTAASKTKTAAGETKDAIVNGFNKMKGGFKKADQ